MKISTLIYLCSIISIDLIYAQNCYVCEQTGCDRPGSSDLQACTDNVDGGKSGKSFVSGALGKPNATTVYTAIQNDFNTFLPSIQVNTTLAPWDTLTQWVCYVTKDKRRGCLIMAKGLCAGDKSWLGQLTAVGDKLAGIVSKATNAVTSMFDSNSQKVLNDDQKGNISNWFAVNYLSKLVNSSTDPQYQLDACCEGTGCNLASMIQKSTIMFIFLILSTLLFV